MKELTHWLIYFGYLAIIALLAWGWTGIVQKEVEFVETFNAFVAFTALMVGIKARYP